MDALHDGGDVLVEVVEVGDDLDEAQIDEGVSAPDDAVADFFF